MSAVERHDEAEEPVRRRRWTADEVARLVEVGVLREDEPLELLDGELIVVSPQGPKHSAVAGELRDRLLAILPGGHHVREEKPIDAGVDSLPEPDVAVVRGRQRDFVDSYPSASDVVLAVEVAVTSQKIDRKKALVYGQAGVPVYWILDVAARKLEVYQHPSMDGYRVVTILADTEEVEVPGTSVRWRVADLLP